MENSKMYIADEQLIKKLDRKYLKFIKDIREIDL